MIQFRQRFGLNEMQTLAGGHKYCLTILGNGNRLDQVPEIPFANDFVLTKLETADDRADANEQILTRLGHAVSIASEDPDTAGAFHASIRRVDDPILVEMICYAYRFECTDSFFIHQFAVIFIYLKLYNLFAEVCKDFSTMLFVHVAKDVAGAGQRVGVIDLLLATNPDLLDTGDVFRCYNLGIELAPIVRRPFAHRQLL